MLHANQIRALEVSQANDFKSGIHSHATGTGKSWIALEMINKFQESRAPSPVLIVWICEQKFVLQGQFDTATITTKGYTDVLKKFLIHDYVSNKPADWVSQVEQACIWKRSQLVLINRAFLTSQERYKQLRRRIDLIIHDECHSIINKSTQTFYAHLMQKQGPATRVIGFTATPNTSHEPLNNVLSYYSIADAVHDKVILPLRIHWLKSHNKVTDKNIKDSLKQILELQPYRKVIVWCGMIERCFEAAAEWAEDFKEYMIAVDTSHGNGLFESYANFAAAEGNALLFCAAKHREGSDIPNLDTCVFLDRVENRNAKTFVQCVGRVLRRDKDGRKKYGVVLDVCAASSIKVCDRINEYLNPNVEYFPFMYNMKHFPPLQIHTLQMTVKPQRGCGMLYEPSDGLDLRPYFVRAVPLLPEYKERLENELALITSKRLGHYLLQAVEILKITAGIPHVTRGSCGSSLVVYLMGISHVDPIKYGISFARFLTEFRDTLPDIDFDFPYNLRDEVFLQLQQRWPNRLARISNHVHYHEKSAMRQAARENGLKGNMSTLEIMNKMRHLAPKVKQQIIARQKELNNKFRTYSLHCGGIVFYPDGVPAKLKLNNRTIPQISLDKRNVAENKQFKIDILSSRALAILYECMDYKEIDFEHWEYDEATANLFCSGDNIGIILGESPLIRKAFRHFQPRSLDDLAICLAIIRPAARDAKNAVTTADLTAKRVYDDDAITLIASALGCSEAEGDKWRRGLTKGDEKVMAAFAVAIKVLPKCARELLVKQLEGLRDYSFCKAHAYSYAQLVWKLAWCKAHKPHEFWSAVIRHADSYYKRWVHLYEARLSGVNVEYKGHASIYAEVRRLKPLADQSPVALLRRKGVWSGMQFFPNCYFIQTAQGCKYNGIIASSRVIGYGKIKTAVICLGVGPKMYIDVLIQSRRLSLANKIGMKGEGVLVEPYYYSSKEGKFYIY